MVSSPASGAKADSAIGSPEPTTFDAIAGWGDDDHLAALTTFCSSAHQMLRQSYRSGAFEINVEALNSHARQAVLLNEKLQQKVSPPQAAAEARRFFERNFNPVRMNVSQPPAGFVTGYFEPELQASLKPTDEYCVPLHRRPDDLIDLSDHNRPDQLDGTCQFGRLHQGKIVEYFDRAAIQQGALDDRNLELVWLKDKTDAYFVHVQGSARLILPDNRVMRIGYAAKSGHPYTSIGKLLCQQTGIPATEMTADRLADWMRGHPNSVDQLTAQNRSYIFFKVVEDTSESHMGPIGAAKVALTPGRSLAVDHALHHYGTPIWVESPDDLLKDGKPFSRLMVAQDTGSAIVGIERGDIFVGSGLAAGLCAGRIRNPASFTLLVPKP